jgi:hypothetical protein
MCTVQAHLDQFPSERTIHLREEVVQIAFGNPVRIRYRIEPRSKRIDQRWRAGLSGIATICKVP